jgi:seryl-tRNA synthetase
LFGSRWFDREESPKEDRSISVNRSIVEEDNDSQQDAPPSTGRRKYEYGKYFQPNEERCSNSFATSSENLLRKDADAEEEYARMRKNKKRIEKAKESLSRLMDKYERCFARDPDVPPPSIPRKLAG